MSHIQSVLGSVPLGDRKISFHEHIYVDRMAENRADGLLHDPTTMEHELKIAKDAGIDMIVDLSSIGIGRDPLGVAHNPLKLAELSRATGIEIVTCTGHYGDPFLDRKWLDSRSHTVIADGYIADIHEGIGDTGIKAGVIGELSSQANYVSSAEERILHAAARAHRVTGASVLVQAPKYPVAFTQLDILIGDGVDPRKIVIGNANVPGDEDYVRELARRGANVGLDLFVFGTPSRYDLERFAKLIMKLVDDGRADQLILSSNVGKRSHLTVYGGGGYAYVLSAISVLEEHGVPREVLQDATNSNPSRILALE